MKVVALLLISVNCAALALAQVPEAAFEAIRQAKFATAVRISEKITIDGRLDEPAWQRATPAGDFIQHAPLTGALPNQNTDARFLYDDDNLYLGVVCSYEAGDGIIVSELKRDFAYPESDDFGIVLDTLHDLRSGLSFVVNAAGAKRDTQVTNGVTNQDWDAVWDAKVARNDTAYTIEFVIPFKTLRFSNSATQEWGLNMFRHILIRNEEDTWAPVPIRSGTNNPSFAGTLQGIENIHPGRNLKVKPFVTAAASQFRNESGQMQTLRSLRKIGDYDGGLDLKYSLTPSLTLDGTYRTDFAQVEADQQQVNLTRFNLFFPEKREFFLENAATFSFGPPTDVTGNTNLLPFFSRRIGLSAAGTPIPILGGARLSGKTGPYALGLLAMKTESLAAVPSNSFLVARLKRDLFHNSTIGAIVTSRDSARPGDYNRVFGPDAHFLFHNKLQVDSYVLRSTTGRIPRSAGGDQAKLFSTSWHDDEHIVSVEYNAVQPNFNPEMGFIRRRNITEYFGTASWLPRFRRSAIRNLVFGSTVDYYNGAQGSIETREQIANAGIQFQNGALINFAMDDTFDRLAGEFVIHAGSPRATVPGGDYRYRSYTAKFATRTRGTVSGSGNFNWGRFWNGSRKSFTGNLKLRPSPHVNADLDYTANRIDLPQTSFSADLIGLRLLYAFTPRASINAYIQYNADTHQVSSNIRFNLIHHPLSDLYLVYNDRRDTITGQLLDRAFIFKLTNLFNF